VNKEDLLSMVRYGAELVFSSEASNITGEAGAARGQGESGAGVWALHGSAAVAGLPGAARHPTHARGALPAPNPSHNPPPPPPPPPSHPTPDADIEAIITKGEKDTAALNSKIQDFTEAARQFTLDGGMSLYDYKEEVGAFGGGNFWKGPGAGSSGLLRECCACSLGRRAAAARARAALTPRRLRLHPAAASAEGGGGRA
jgi:hypothetical protein